MNEADSGGQRFAYIDNKYTTSVSILQVSNGQTGPSRSDIALLGSHLGRHIYGT